jgi:hypothetical protein
MREAALTSAEADTMMRDSGGTGHARKRKVREDRGVCHLSPRHTQACDEKSLCA